MASRSGLEMNVIVGSLLSASELLKEAESYSTSIVRCSRTLVSLLRNEIEVDASNGQDHEQLFMESCERMQELTRTLQLAADRLQVKKNESERLFLKSLLVTCAKHIRKAARDLIEFTLRWSSIKQDTKNVVTDSAPSAMLDRCQRELAKCLDEFVSTCRAGAATNHTPEIRNVANCIVTCGTSIIQDLHVASSLAMKEHLKNSNQLPGANILRPLLDALGRLRAQKQSMAKIDETLCDTSEFMHKFSANVRQYAVTVRSAVQTPGKSDVVRRMEMRQAELNCTQSLYAISLHLLSRIMGSVSCDMLRNSTFDMAHAMQNVKRTAASSAAAKADTITPENTVFSFTQEDEESAPVLSTSPKAQKDESSFVSQGDSIRSLEKENQLDENQVKFEDAPTLIQKEKEEIPAKLSSGGIDGLITGARADGNTRLRRALSFRKRDRAKLVEAMSSNRMSAVSSLLGNMSVESVMAVDERGDTALHQCARTNAVGVARRLLTFLKEHDCSLDIKNNKGRTALHLACKKGFRSMAELLIEAGADLNCTTLDLETALHFAADNDHQGICELLISHGANKDAKNAQGEVPSYIPQSESSESNSSALVMNESGELMVDDAKEIQSANDLIQHLQEKIDGFDICWSKSNEEQSSQILQDLDQILTQMKHSPCQSCVGDFEVPMGVGSTGYALEIRELRPLIGKEYQFLVEKINGLLHHVETSLSSAVKRFHAILLRLLQACRTSAVGNDFVVDILDSIIASADSWRCDGTVCKQMFLESIDPRILVNRLSEQVYQQANLFRSCVLTLGSALGSSGMNHPVESLIALAATAHTAGTVCEEMADMSVNLIFQLRALSSAKKRKAARGEFLQNSVELDQLVLQFSDDPAQSESTPVWNTYEDLFLGKRSSKRSSLPPSLHSSGYHEKLSASEHEEESVELGLKASSSSEDVSESKTPSKLRWASRHQHSKSLNGASKMGIFAGKKKEDGSARIFLSSAHRSSVGGEENKGTEGADEAKATEGDRPKSPRLSGEGKTSPQASLLERQRALFPSITKATRRSGTDPDAFSRQNDESTGIDSSTSGRSSLAKENASSDRRAPKKAERSGIMSRSRKLESAIGLFSKSKKTSGETPNASLQQQQSGDEGSGDLSLPANSNTKRSGKNFKTGSKISRSVTNFGSSLLKMNTPTTHNQVHVPDAHPGGAAQSGSKGVVELSASSPEHSVWVGSPEHALRHSGKELRSASLKSMSSITHPGSSMMQEVEDIQAPGCTGIPKLGTLNFLLIRLLTTHNPQFVECFLGTYRSFTSAELLLQKLIECYQVPSTVPVEPDFVNKVKLRVLAVLKTWIGTHIEDFSPPLVREAKQFLSNLMKSSKSAERLYATLERGSSQKSPLEGQFRVKSHLSLVGCFRSLVTDPHHVLFMFSDEEIARQMTILDSELFCSIRVTEFFNCSWSHKNTRHRSPNIRKLIARFNRVGYWLAFLLLLHPRVKQRAVALRRIIGIAMQLRDMGNFNGLMGVLAGLSLSPIHRLKHTWAEIPSHTMVRYRSLQTLMSTNSSYQGYRQALSDQPPPKLPYLGVYLSDLVFIEDGNDNIVHDQVNFYKRYLIWNTLREVQLLQSDPHRFPILEPLRTLISGMTQVPEHALYSISTKLEPRGCARTDIE